MQLRSCGWVWVARLRYDRTDEVAATLLFVDPTSHEAILGGKTLCIWRDFDVFEGWGRR
jgi:hypothetical protein